MRDDPTPSPAGRPGQGSGYPATTNPCRIDDWLRLPESTVEIRRNGTFFRTARVEAATADTRMLWLAQDGIDGRILIDKLDGYEAWIQPRQLQPRQNP